MELLNIRSLRGRYTAVTIIFAIAMLITAWYTHSQLLYAQKITTGNIEARNSLISHTQKIRDTVWRVRNLLAKFQIDPKLLTEHTEMENTIHEAVNEVHLLMQHPVIRDDGVEVAKALQQALNEFANAIKIIKAARTDVMQQYPSLAIAYNEMEPRNRQVLTQLSLAIDGVEQAEKNRVAHAPAVHKTLSDIRYAWTQVISNFRMYMLNRLNVYNETFIPQQVEDINAYFLTIQGYFTSIDKLQKKGAIDIFTAELISSLRPMMLEWHEYFEQVLAINISDEWRRDSIVFQQHVEPALEKLTLLLARLDNIIESSGMQDIHSLSQLARDMLNRLWGATTIALLIIAIGFFLLVKLVLAPIGQITRALKQEANGSSDFTLPEITTDETRDLVDAFSEMREQVHHRQDALEYHALHDTLTGLANRKLLNERLQQAIHNARQEHGRLALLIMDLDRFKDVNDTLGHQVGDQLLTQVGQRLNHVLREADVVARLGGDEFSILLTTARKNQAVDVANKILSSFEQVFHINELNLYLGASIGIALFPNDGDCADSLTQHADIAMYTAKRNKLGYALYDPLRDTYSIGKLSMITELKHAINQKELELVYQPIIELESNRIIGAEALIRWQHERFGEISPSELIPLAEHAGLIHKLTQFVVEGVINTLTHLQKESIQINLSLNISVYNLQDNEFLEWLIGILDNYRLAARHIVLEVTENVMMSEPLQIIERLRDIQNTGVMLSIDDYGTGFSSLSYLKKLPITTIKIDKSFVIDMFDDENDAVIIRSTIDMAHNLGFKVIAEGIESRDALDILSILDCDAGQGFHIHHPVPLQEFIQWAKKNPRFSC